jgi:hypothetical protein
MFAELLLPSDIITDYGTVTFPGLPILPIDRENGQCLFMAVTGIIIRVAVEQPLPNQTANSGWPSSRRTGHAMQMSNAR